MNFTQSIKTCFFKYADFKGRASRSECWWFFLCIVLLYGVLGLFNKTEVYIATYLVIFMPKLAVTVRRLHDTGRSGYWLLLPFVFFLGPMLIDIGVESDIKFGLMFTFVMLKVVSWIIIGVWLAFKGKPEVNKYGEPLGEDGKPISSANLTSDGPNNDSSKMS